MLLASVAMSATQSSGEKAGQRAGRASASRRASKAQPAVRRVPPDQAFEGFSQAFERFSLATRRARGRVSREDGLPLTLSQYHLLEALDRCDRLPVGKVAEAAGVSAPTATRMLDSLEKDGVVTRVRSSEDRRVVEAALTGEGHKLVRRKRRAVERTRRTIFERLDPGEREGAEWLLLRLAEALEEQG
jgi:MarR family transcriptional regulator, organic hydroperoxide resistance regulator